MHHFLTHQHLPSVYLFGRVLARQTQLEHKLCHINDLYCYRAFVSVGNPCGLYVQVGGWFVLGSLHFIDRLRLVDQEMAGGGVLF